MKSSVFIVNKFLFFHLMIGALSGLLILIFINMDYSPETFIYPLSLASVLLSLWCIMSWKRATGSLFNPYTLFLTSVILFNSGQTFLYIFGLMPNGYFDGELNSTIIEETLLFVISSIYALHLGALLAINKSKAKHKQIDSVMSAKSLRLVGWFLFFISISSSFIILKYSLDIVATSGYFGLYKYKSGISNVHQVLSAFLMPSSLFMLAGSKNKRSTLLFSVLIILTYSFIQFYLGSRSNAVIQLVAFFWLYDRCIKRLSRPLLFSAGASMLFIVLPLVKSFRSLVRDDNFTIATILEKYFSIDNPVVLILKEMGFTMSTVAHIINLVPANRVYDLGTGYYYAFLTFMPNVFWDVHPSIIHGTYDKWLTLQVDPIYASLGGGMGFSGIAEAYINFGWFGLLIMGALGFLSVKFYYNAALTNNIPKLAFISCFFSYFLFYARSESIEILRPLLWYAFIPFLMYIVIYNHYVKSKKRMLYVPHPHLNKLIEGTQ